MALNAITKKEILDQLEKNHTVEVPQNLVDNELKSIPNNPNSNKDENSAQSVKKRIKLGLILNEYGETNKIKVTEDEIKTEIQKQVKSMPGQEKFVFEYYQKFFKSKINLVKKELTIKEAEKLIKSFNENNKAKATPAIKKKESEPAKSKKISKK